MPISSNCACQHLTVPCDICVCTLLFVCILFCVINILLSLCLCSHCNSLTLPVVHYSVVSTTVLCPLQCCAHYIVMPTTLFCPLQCCAHYTVVPTIVLCPLCTQLRTFHQLAFGTFSNLLMIPFEFHSRVAQSV